MAQRTEEIEMATNGAEVKEDRSVIALGPLYSGNMPVVDSNHSSLPNAKRKRELEEHEKPKQRMDISMHNQGGIEVEDYRSCLLMTSRGWTFEERIGMVSSSLKVTV